MNIQPVSVCRPRVNFKANDNKQKYENPINRSTEKKLTVLQTAGLSAAAGAVAGGLATCFIPETASKRLAKAGGVGLAVAAAAMALTLPAKLYDTKVGSFTREKEMEVFSRDREVKSNLLDEVNETVKDSEVPLGDKINYYATMQMAANKSGVLVKNMNN